VVFQIPELAAAYRTLPTALSCCTCVGPLVAVHVLPPSVVTLTVPDVSKGAANATEGLVGSTATMAATGPPAEDHVAPPSVVRTTPALVPAYTTPESDGATATDVADVTGIACHVAPASVLWYTPLGDGLTAA
jgi:hypothetical protein